MNEEKTTISIRKSDKKKFDYLKWKLSKDSFETIEELIEFYSQNKGIELDGN